MKTLKIPQGFYVNFDWEVKLPTFICSCGEEILDTPSHRLQSLNAN